MTQYFYLLTIMLVCIVSMIAEGVTFYGLCLYLTRKQWKYALLALITLIIISFFIWCEYLYLKTDG
jgi:high-affinity Fe2+/Pb2+ permease